MIQQHRIIMEKSEIIQSIKNITKASEIKLITAIGSTDADMNPTVEFTFEILDKPNAPQE